MGPLRCEGGGERWKVGEVGQNWPWHSTNSKITLLQEARIWLAIPQNEEWLLQPCGSQIDWTADARWVCLAWLHLLFSMLSWPEAFVLLENLQYARACFIFFILLVIFMVCCLQLCFIMGLEDVYYMACCYCADYNHPLVSGGLRQHPPQILKFPNAQALVQNDMVCGHTLWTSSRTL